MSGLEKRYAVAEMRVEIINFYGSYLSEHAAQAKAERMAESTGYVNAWVVFEYDGYNKWTATDYVVQKPGRGGDDTST